VGGGLPYKGETGPPVLLTLSSGAVIDNHDGLAAGLQAAVVKLKAAGKRVWMVGPIPDRLRCAAQALSRPTRHP
jgi:hypothetical protein